MSVSGLLLANGYPHSVMTGPTMPGVHAVGVDASAPPASIKAVPDAQLPVLALQHMPPVQVSPGMHLFMGWHEHPSPPGLHMVVSTTPEAPAGIWHIPDVHTPLAQSAPVVHVEFGSMTAGMQNPPVHLPLWQSLAWVQCEPAGEPELVPAPEPPSELEPPSNVEPLAPDVEPLAPDVEPEPVATDDEPASAVME
jgi:hypothetical protein